MAPSYSEKQVKKWTKHCYSVSWKDGHLLYQLILISYLQEILWSKKIQNWVILNFLYRKKGPKKDPKTVTLLVEKMDTSCFN